MRRDGEALLRVDLCLRRGDLCLAARFELGAEVVSVIGPNGAGKTSLLLALLGLLRPEAGRIVCDGGVLYDSQLGEDVAVEDRALAYVPQDHGLLPHLSALDNIAFALACGHPCPGRAERRRLATAMLAEVGASAVAGRRPDQLSGGERQRVALARALVASPAALLCDEPMSAVASDARGHLRLLLLEAARTLRVPVLVVTHDRDDALALAGRVLVVENGQARMHGSARELAARPSSPFVTRFFSTEAHREEFSGRRLKVV